MVVYLNNAATSWPKPSCVARAVAAAIEGEPCDPLRGGFGPDPLDDCRQMLAEYLGCEDASRIALFPNATVALNVAIQGLDLQCGDVALSTTAEHNSVMRPLHKLHVERGVEVVYLPVTREGRIDVARWEEACTRYQPKLAVFTHASNVTGAINPVEQLAAAAKRVGAYCVLDASQTMGYLENMPDLSDFDAVAFTGHKYLLGPQGTGGLWVAPNVELQPLLVGGTGIRSDELGMPKDMPLHVEAGTANAPSFAGLAAAIEWRTRNPLDHQRIEQLLDRLADGLREAGARPVVVAPPRTPIVSFDLPNCSVEEAGFILAESFEIACRTGLHCAPNILQDIGFDAQGSIRLSMSRFTTEEDIECVIDAVRSIVDVSA